MKKSLVAALTTALVVGAASTTFAAANPFSDVPADHWAYDAIAQLASDGVIDGYGDASFRGQQSITRYEMAQMIAKAMAKGNSSAMLDKLAAEFSEELNNLGVRVAALEKKVDNVKWTGRIRYRAQRTTKKAEAGKKQSNANGTNNLLYRFDVAATVNKNWTAKTRLDYSNTGMTKTAANGTAVTVDRLYAEGKYGKTTIQLGKFANKVQADYGLSGDYRMTGARVAWGGKPISVAVYGGRYNYQDYDTKIWNHYAAATATAVEIPGDTTGDMFGIEVYNDRKAKLTYGVAYQQFTYEPTDATKVTNKYPGDKIQTLGVGLGYKFGKDFALEAAYAKNLKKYGIDSNLRERMRFLLKYKGANPAKAGSWGLFGGYLYEGTCSGVYNSIWLSTYGYAGDFRGWEFAGEVTLDKNITTQLKVMSGNLVSNGQRSNRIISETNFYF